MSLRSFLSSMLNSRRFALGAVLAATSSSSVLSLDATVPTDQEPSSDQVSAIVSRAKQILAESQATSSPQHKKAPFASISPIEAARAREVLDRYYAISAEAQAANIPEPQEVTVVKVTPKKPKAIRTTADKVFDDFDTTVPVGPFCKKYVICGGGTAAWSAIEAILESDPNAAKDILLISEEEHHPYNRTVLSKELWEDAKKDLFRSEQAAKHAVEYRYKFAKPEAGTVSTIRGKRVVELNVDDKTLLLSDGTRLQYHKFLLATGGSPRNGNSISPALASHDISRNVSVFRTLDDYRQLKASLEQSDAGVVVIGGGFLGTELAIALASSSRKVSLVVAEAGVLYRVLPRYLCEYLAHRLSDIGVNVVRSAIVTGVSKHDNAIALDLASPDANRVEGGKVIVAVGIDPATELARGAGLELDDVNGGVIVNDFMMAEPDVFAAGDVASFHDRSLGRRRVEHWDHAVVSGQIAGKNMVGGRARYGFQSMFWSDLTNIGVSFTAVGRVEAGLETIGVWNLGSDAVEGAPTANDYRSGVVYYLKDGEVIGAVLWNPKRGAGGLRRARALVDAKTRLGGLDESTLAGLVNLEASPLRTTIRTQGV